MTNKHSGSLLSLFAPGRDRMVLSMHCRERSTQEEFEALPEPFIKIGETRFADLYAARLESADGLMHKQVVVKIQKDGSPPAGFNNESVERILQQESHALGSFAYNSESPTVQTYLHHRGESVAPVFFCKRVQQFFHVLCPECGGLLRDCRDDKKLQSHGLPGYGDSQQRYLTCEACSGKKTKNAVFYAQHNEQNRAGVSDRWQLVQQYKNLLQMETDIDFPCRQCQFKGACYDGDNSEAARLLVPLSFHDFHVTIHEWLPLHYDEFVDYLGGRDWQALLEELRKRYDLDRLELLGKEPPLAAFAGFLHAAGDGNRFAQEILYGKLLVFHALCMAVSNMSAKLQRPVFGLNPEKIWIGVRQPYSTGRHVPAYWNFDLKLANLDSVLSDNGRIQPVLNMDNVSEYLPPSIKQSGENHRHIGRITLTGMRDKDGVVAMQLLMDAPGEQEPPFSRIELCFDRDQGFRQSLPIEAAVKGRQGGRLVLEVEGVHLDQGALAQMKVLSSLPAVKIPVKPLHAMDESVDLYSLGMLLARTMLVNERQSLDSISSLLASWSSKWRQQDDQDVLQQLARERAFCAEQVFFSARGQGSVVKGWQGVLTLIMDLLSGRIRQAENLVARVSQLIPVVKEAMLREQADLGVDLQTVLNEIIQDPAWMDKLPVSDASVTSNTVERFGRKPIDALDQTLAQPPLSDGTLSDATLSDATVAQNALVRDESVQRMFPNDEELLPTEIDAGDYAVTSQPRPNQQPDDMDQTMIVNRGEGVVRPDATVVMNRPSMFNDEELTGNTSGVDSTYREDLDDSRDEQRDEFRENYQDNGGFDETMVIAKSDFPDLPEGEYTMHGKSLNADSVNLDESFAPPSIDMDRLPDVDSTVTIHPGTMDFATDGLSPDTMSRDTRTRGSISGDSMSGDTLPTDLPTENASTVPRKPGKKSTRHTDDDDDEDQDQTIIIRPDKS